MIELVLGGARSGKSSYAEAQARLTKLPRIYLATATAGDEEMAHRIEHHQQLREQEQWELIEEPIQIANVLSDLNEFLGSNQAVVIDCLTLWISNCLHEDCLEKQTEKLLRIVEHFDGQLFIVSNEVGSGIVPLGQLNRQFVDAAGRLHQQIAKLADKVTLVVAGLPMPLKDEINHDP